MNDEPEPVHEMTITETHEGTEIWDCPICGRRLFIEWEPFHKYVDRPGDEYAAHAGGKGGLTMGGAEVEQGNC